MDEFVLETRDGAVATLVEQDIGGVEQRRAQITVVIGFFGC